MQLQINCRMLILLLLLMYQTELMNGSSGADDIEFFSTVINREWINRLWYTFVRCVVSYPSFHSSLTLNGGVIFNIHTYSPNLNLFFSKLAIMHRWYIKILLSRGREGMMTKCFLSAGLWDYARYDWSYIFNKCLRACNCA